MAFLKTRIEMSSAYNALDKKDFNALLNFLANYSDEIEKIKKIEKFVKDNVKAATPNRTGEFLIKGCSVKVTRQPKKTTDSYLQKTVTISKKKTR